MIQENNAAKYFCGFRLCEVTPDFSLFRKTLKKMGPEELGGLFAKIRDPLRAHGYMMNKVFNFVDASHLVNKAVLWEQRDEALNNQTLPKVAKDKQTRFGCKGGNDMA